MSCSTFEVTLPQAATADGTAKLRITCTVEVIAVRLAKMLGELVAIALVEITDHTFGRSRPRVAHMAPESPGKYRAHIAMQAMHRR